MFFSIQTLFFAMSSTVFGFHMKVEPLCYLSFHGLPIEQSTMFSIFLTYCFKISLCILIIYGIVLQRIFAYKCMFSTNYTTPIMPLFLFLISPLCFLDDLLYFHVMHTYLHDFRYLPRSHE